MARTLTIYNKISFLRQRYYQALSGKESLIKLINESEVAEQVFNSNAIENSTLTLEETEKILLQIDLDRFISERELFEARNLARVVEYIHTRAKEKELNLEMMLNLHQMLLANILKEAAGRFRQTNEYVRVGSHIAPASNEIVPRLEEMLVQYHANNVENIIARVARLHLIFEHIHPFVDGNGRLGRVINNYLLIREGYVPINIKYIDKKHYYQAFREFDSRQDITIMTELVGKALSNSYHKRLAYLENKRIIKLADYARESRISYSNLLNKANRQTIEAFLEKGVWKIGVDK